MPRESELARLLDHSTSSCFAPDRVAESTGEAEFYAVAPRTKPMPAVPANSMRDLGQNTRDLGRAVVAGKFATTSRTGDWAKVWIDAARTIPPAKVDHELSFERAEVE